MLRDQNAALIQVAIGNGEGPFHIRVHGESPVQTQAQPSERRATGSEIGSEMARDDLSGSFGFHRGGFILSRTLRAHPGLHPDGPHAVAASPRSSDDLPAPSNKDLDLCAGTITTGALCLQEPFSVKPCPVGKTLYLSSTCVHLLVLTGPRVRHPVAPVCLSVPQSVSLT